jgi:hypothetical protein
MNKRNAYLDKLYPQHDLVLEGVDSFTGLGMYRCTRCHKSDTDLGSIKWQREQAQKKLDALKGKDDCV